jgi:hypothetical protein
LGSWTLVEERNLGELRSSVGLATEAHSGKQRVSRAPGIEIHTKRWPIIDVVYGPRACEDDLDRAFAEYARLSSTGERVGYLVDMREFNPVFGPAKVRRYASEVFRRHIEVLRPVTACEARVVSNAMTSGILTAFDWLTGTKWPCATFVKMESADEWVKAQMRSRQST